MPAILPRSLPLHFTGVNLLIVLDHRSYVPCSFAPEAHGPSKTEEAEYPWFGLSHVLQLLNADDGILVTLAHRSADPALDSPEHQDYFVFTEDSLNSYDVIWLIGAGNSPNADGSFPGPGTTYESCTAVDSYPLQDSEVAALVSFMARGGGVMAVGDHSDYGCSMGHRIPRVRDMRRWTVADNVPPASGLGTISTIQPAPYDNVNYPVPNGWPVTFTRQAPDYDAEKNAVPPGALNVAFEDQSDDIPAPVRVTMYYRGPAWGGGTYSAHPLMSLPDGTLLNSLPDHMHEGAVPDLDSQSWKGEDWPTAADGTFPAPSTIAWGKSLYEVDHVEYGPEGGFVTDYESPGPAWWLGEYAASGLPILPPSFTGDPGHRAILTADLADVFLNHAFATAVVAVRTYAAGARTADGTEPVHALIDSAIADGFRQAGTVVSSAHASLIAAVSPPAT